MNRFVHQDSIVRKIWSTTDITLFIFAGAAAEFALNREVDWLYFTGALPANPIGRLFSTVQYAQKIIFEEQPKAVAAIDKIHSIHKNVEAARGRHISQNGYKGVLFMLIHYSISAYELLERPLTVEEKDDIVDTFSKIGARMQIPEMPDTWQKWIVEYDIYLNADLVKTAYTTDLYRKYRQHLGYFRYLLVLETQRLLVSHTVAMLLDLHPRWPGKVMVTAYRLIRKTGWQRFIVYALVPSRFRGQLQQMDRHAH